MFHVARVDRLNCIGWTNGATGLAIRAPFGVYLSIAESHTDCRRWADSGTEPAAGAEFFSDFEHSLPSADFVRRTGRCFTTLCSSAALGPSALVAHCDASWRRDKPLQFLRATIWADHVLVRHVRLLKCLGNLSTPAASILIYGHGCLQED